MGRERLPEPDFRPLGDAAVRVGFGERIDPQLNHAVRLFMLRVKQAGIHGVSECASTYAAVTVYYQPARVRYAPLCAKLLELIRDAKQAALPPASLVVLPVCYGGSLGPDLDYAARHASLSAAEFIQRHCAKDYLVYMLGFAPGFAYLGGLDPALHCPRHITPRLSVPAGSVGIGGEQTGVYPLTSPGGWRLLGRTPVRLFDPQRQPEVLLQAGDFLRFKPVDEPAYREIEAAVAAGTYCLERAAVET